MPARTQPTSANLPPRKLLLFAAATLLLFFVLLEGGLALFGVQPAIVGEDPFVGFSSYRKLYRPASSGDALETAPDKLALFNAQQFSRRKPPGTVRIFTVGGSTTYGRPFEDGTSFSGWLRSYLQALPGERRWEVINAGGISYASYRVAALMEELVQYDPDLFVIYSGNNEFLEKRTYGELIDAPAAWTRTRGLLGRSRLWTVGRGIVDSRRNRARDRYELTGEVRELLDNSAGLELYERDEPFERQVLEHYRFNLQRMVDLARSRGARVILVNIPVNEKDMAPFKSQHREGLSADQQRRFAELLAGARAELRAGRADSALQAAREAVELDPEYADGQYLLGRAWLAADRPQPAATAFARAIAEDVCPLRALDEINAAISETAARNDVRLVDYRQQIRTAARERTGSPIAGDELFLDHVHPTVEANGMLARALVEPVVEGGIPGLSTAMARVEPAVHEQVLARVDDAAHARAYKNLSKVLIWAGKQEEAERYVRRAEELLPGDWEVQYNAGRIAAEAGEYERAVEQLREASRLNPSRAEPYDLLGSVYATLGQVEQAIEAGLRATAIAPEKAFAWNNLGTYYRTAGRTDLALEVTRKAVEIDPELAEARNNLGNLYFDLGRPEEALRSYDRALALRARYPAATVSRGLVLGQLGRLDEAMQAFSEALRIDPRLPTAHVGRGKVLLSRNDPMGAIAAFKQAVESDPSHVEGFEMLARALTMVARPEEALRALERGLRHNPESDALHHLVRQLERR